MQQRCRWSEFEMALITQVRMRLYCQTYGLPLLSSTHPPPTRTKLWSIWKDIGKELDESDAYCRKRWKSIRDSYTRLFKTGRSTTHSGRVISKYTDGSLSFLDQFITENSDEAKMKKRKLSSQTSANVFHCTSFDIIETDEYPQVETTLVTQEMIESLLKKKENDESELESDPEVINALKSSDLEKTIDKYTAQNLDLQSDNSNDLKPNVSIDNYGLVISEVTPCSSDLSKTFENIKEKEFIIDDDTPVEENLDNIVISSLKDDGLSDIRAFFRQMGDYVWKKFPQEKHMEIRSKIMSLITEEELEIKK